MKYIFLAIINLLVFSSCDSGEAGPMVSRDNLEVEFNLAGANEANPNGDGSGVVQITAFEDNAVRYAFKVDTGEQIESESGSMEYVFTKEGLHTYTIVAWAYAESGQFVNKTFTVEVFKSSQVAGDGYTTPLQHEGYDLVWQDEFEGNALSNDWTPEIGTGSNGWGNNELQYYRAENTTVGGGYLTIEAKEESFGGSSYTSSRLITKDKQEFQFGRIDMRAILPSGQGVWPALWMLGANFDQVGWPKSGELDIMEKIGGGIRESQVLVLCIGTIMANMLVPVDRGRPTNYLQGLLLMNFMFSLCFGMKQKFSGW